MQSHRYWIAPPPFCRPRQINSEGLKIHLSKNSEDAQRLAKNDTARQLKLTNLMVAEIECQQKLWEKTPIIFEHYLLSHEESPGYIFYLHFDVQCAPNFM